MIIHPESTPLVLPKKLYSRSACSESCTHSMSMATSMLIIQRVKVQPLNEPSERNVVSCIGVIEISFSSLCFVLRVYPLMMHERDVDRLTIQEFIESK